MKIQFIAKSISNFKPANFMHVRSGAHKAGHFDPKLLRPAQLNVASLWVFAAVAPDQSIWSLWGNFTEQDPYGIQFNYPTEV